MTDKDLLVVISEMLRKQDQQSEILGKHTQILQETRDALSDFIDISTQEFQRNNSFNERQERFNERQEGFNERQEGFNEKMLEFNSRFLAQFDRQNEFNERFLDKLDEIAKKP
ncbi:hypothetical protein [Mucilaginibacter sp. L3T2-6]|uniref:hypothetical protein n=1 Tax=Mucilaginibacter sp. L3T2-6 TaxID=3062491 RepID=UPI0026749BF5|nr:hypothetical protein [Mucilaginibacter sp. L3T2-6]MDO3640369.1 hypothetical protein [Mucilaginibacter sp. L3T2-6]MDV6213292.1 hypothetical protein [Mucilaginibacter sp. L3T2-6]